MFVSRKHATFIGVLAVPAPAGPRAAGRGVDHAKQPFPAALPAFLRPGELCQMLADKLAYAGPPPGGINPRFLEHVLVHGQGDVLHGRLHSFTYYVELRSPPQSPGGASVYRTSQRSSPIVSPT